MHLNTLRVTFVKENAPPGNFLLLKVSAQLFMTLFVSRQCGQAGLPLMKTSWSVSFTLFAEYGPIDQSCS
jgi:hypothetical protein